MSADKTNKTPSAAFRAAVDIAMEYGKDQAKDIVKDQMVDTETAYMVFGEDYPDKLDEFEQGIKLAPRPNQMN